MINRLVPAGISLGFCAKEKSVPGEISRVKRMDEISQNKLENSPKFDTFTASAKADSISNINNEQLPHDNKKKSTIFCKKGNA